MSMEQIDSQFRPYVVVEKRRESRIITSFVLRPLERDGWRSFKPGQYLVFRIPTSDGQHILRHYSISNDPAVDGAYRITVKREGSSREGVPDGLGSCYLHDHVAPGAVLHATGPRGAFTLDLESTRPIVLLSGGVGLTPLVAMLHAAKTLPNRRVAFIHACLDGTVHALADEVDTVAATHEGVLIHTVYQKPTDEDRIRRRYRSEGLITKDLLQTLLPLDDYEFYVCGPPPFMRSVFEILLGLGIRKERISYELFGPASAYGLELLLPQAAANPGPIAVSTAPPLSAKMKALAPTVTCSRSGRVLTWDPRHESLLALLEANGLRPEFSCREGVCGTCSTPLVNGAVRYTGDPLEPKDGEILLCCSQPTRSIVIDI